MTYQLSPEIDLPSSAVTSTFAYLGIRGYGKSYAAGVQVEDFLGVGAQVVVIDPVGIWWGLRLAAGGAGPSGFDVPVFGGTHGDLPLEPTAGELVARIAAEQRRSMVLDVSDWTLGEQRRFVTAFATLLFQLKKANRSPIHLVFEEAHEFFPQFVEGASAPLVGATNRLWKVGRNYGIGGTLISQRAAEVNKSALNLTETLVTTRLKAPEDVKRIDGWVNANGAGGKAILPDLPKQQLIVWTDQGAVITKYRAKRTFDASRTPEAGDAHEAPAALPPLDVAAIRRAMAATIEEAQQNDPKALRARIAELEKIGKTIGAAERESIAVVQRERDAYKAERDLARGRLVVMRDALRDLSARAASVALLDDEVRDIAATKTDVKTTRDIPQSRATTEVLPRVTVTSTATNGTAKGSTSGAARMLGALGHAHPRPLTRGQLAVRSLLAPKSGTYGNYIAKLLQEGLIAREGDLYQLTEKGAAASALRAPALSGSALVDAWCGEFYGRAKDVLRLLVRQSPMTKAAIADAIGCRSRAGPSGTTWRLSRLPGSSCAPRVASPPPTTSGPDPRGISRSLQPHLRRLRAWTASDVERPIRGSRSRWTAVPTSSARGSVMRATGTSTAPRPGMTGPIEDLGAQIVVRRSPRVPRGGSILGRVHPILGRVAPLLGRIQPPLPRIGVGGVGGGLSPDPDPDRIRKLLVRGDPVRNPGRLTTGCGPLRRGARSSARPGPAGTSASTATPATPGDAPTSATCWSGSRSRRCWRPSRTRGRCSRPTWRRRTATSWQRSTRSSSS